MTHRSLGAALLAALVAGCSGGPDFDARHVPACGEADANALTAVDTNGDGADEIAVTCMTQTEPARGLAEIWRLDGDDGFARSARHDVGTEDRGEGGHAVVAGDLDGDGRTDLAVADDGHHVHGISVLPGREGGGFGPAVYHGHESYGMQSMRLLDADGDGHRDLVLPRYAAGMSSVFFIRAGEDGLDPGADPERIEAARVSGLDPAPRAPVERRAIRLLRGDFDGAGGTDEFVLLETDGAPADRDTYRFHLWLADGGDGFTSPGAVELADYPNRVAAGDFDGDGREDFAILRIPRETGDAPLIVYLNRMSDSS